ncbi:MAG TPA: M14 family zinc carboxypeptidase [Solirubrobacter sp.]|nr:M14 family zinc carboxypeptidase [Solirubrobacter sp.]
MRRWIGAAALAAAMVVAPATAGANDDAPALLQFKLDNSSLYDDFERLGFDMDHAVENGQGDDIIVSAWVNDEQLAFARANGFENVGVVHDKFNFERIRAESLASKNAELAAKRALSVNAAGVKGRSAMPGSVRAQRADRYENNVGKFISIEANTDGVSYTCTTNPQNGRENCTYVGPTLMAEWYDAEGNKMGQGLLDDHPDPDVSPDFYQYHSGLFRVGDKGDDTPDVASVKIASSNGDVDTIAAKDWVSTDPPGPATGFKSGFVTRYYDSIDAYQKMRDLAAEFPNISEVYELPNKTWGYQRPAATMLGYVNTTNPPNATTPYVRFDDNNLPLAGSAPATAQQPSTVVVTSKVMGHLGGNSLTAQIVPSTAPNQALDVTVTGNALRVFPATDDQGAVTSTANQVIAAINADEDATKIVRATKYRQSSGDGIVEPGVRSPLSDLLRAPSTVPRGPQTMTMLRIGKHRDGSKVGVYLYCQEHAAEIATSGVCLETAERLVRNYGTDPQTTALVDGLDIFLVPQINGDGAIHSIYDSPRRTNMAPYCYDPANTENLGDPANRNGYGVNINRNFSVGSVFDGFQGASTGCSGGNTAGPFELSEPETRNEVWVQSTFRNVKFSNNIHSSGGYFMWPPGSYTPQRVSLPYPPYGTLNFFDQAARHVLDGIKSHRGTAIRPERTGPVIDVLYSAAGNSADEAYYNYGIVGYDFEIGDLHYNDTGSGPATCNPGQQPPFGDSTNDCLDNEGFHEAMEFSSGNYGLLQSALEYANDITPPVVEAVKTLRADASSASYEIRFKSDEAASIYYTTDGSTPTTASTEWKPNRPRALPLPLDLAIGTTLQWIATDFKGNISEVRSETLIPHVDVDGDVGGDVPATLSLTLGTPATFGAFVPGVADTYTASTTANVISTAGDATLDVTDPSSTATGHLVNGAFSLAQPLKVGGQELPATVKTYDAPVSNDAVALEFSQEIGENEALRTGTYSKTLTFTLSTTTP